MANLSYVTGNAVKFLQAQAICSPVGLELQQVNLDIPEIQAESGEVVGRDKANKAFAQLQKPVVISDDSWMIPGLNNFPGVYMKYVNQWFTSDDWLRLTAPLEDRRIIFQQVVVYQDATQQKVFSIDIVGTLLTEIRGHSELTHTNIVTLDNGITTLGENIVSQTPLTQNLPTSWHNFIVWYKENSP